MRLFAKKEPGLTGGQVRSSDEFALVEDAFVPGIIGAISGAATAGVWLMNSPSGAAENIVSAIFSVATLGAPAAYAGAMCALNEGEPKTHAKSYAAAFLLSTLATCSANGEDNTQNNEQVSALISQPQTASAPESTNKIRYTQDKNGKPVIILPYPNAAPEFG